MLGIKYRYEILDDNKLKLAPTKGTWLATGALTVLSVFAPVIIIGVSNKLEERRDRKADLNRIKPPNN